MATEFKLPELGENIGKVDVTGVMVSVGDTIAIDDPVLEIDGSCHDASPSVSSGK